MKYFVLDFDGTITKHNGQTTFRQEYFNIWLKTRQLYRRDRSSTIDIPKYLKQWHTKTLEQIYRESSLESTAKTKKEIAKELLADNALIALECLLSSREFTTIITTRNYPPYIIELLQTCGVQDELLENLTIIPVGSSGNKGHIMSEYFKDKWMKNDQCFIYDDSFDDIYSYKELQDKSLALKEATITYVECGRHNWAKDEYIHEDAAEKTLSSRRCYCF